MSVKWMVVLQRRNTTSRSPKSSLPSLDQIDRQFNDAEMDRTRIFEQMCKEQELEFIREEIGRWEPADMRQSEFIKFLVNSRELFETNQEKRMVTFETGERRRDDVASMNEKERMNIFEKAMQRRSDAFEKALETQRKDAELGARQRAEIVERGVKGRNEVSDKMMKEFISRFDILVRTERTSFKESQRRREASAKELVTQRTTARHQTDSIVKINGDNEGEDGEQEYTGSNAQPSTEQSRSQSPGAISLPPEAVPVMSERWPSPYPPSLRSETPERLPSPLHLPDEIRTPSPPVIIHPPYSPPPRTTTSTSDSEPRRRSGRLEGVAISTKEANQDGKPSDDEESTNDVKSLVSYYDTLFEDNQQQKLSKFQSDQKSRNDRFEEGERSRRFDGSTKIDDFHKSCSTQFQESLAQFQSWFEDQEGARTEHGASARQEIHETAKAGEESEFEQQQLSIKQQSDIAEEIWASLFKDQKNNIDALLQAMQTTIYKIISTNTERFSEFLRTQERILEVTPTRIPGVPMSPVLGRERSYTRQRRHPVYGSPVLVDRHWRMGAAPVIVPAMPSPISPRLRTLEPELFFAPPRIFPQGARMRSRSGGPNLSKEDRKMLSIGNMFKTHETKFRNFTDQRWQEFKDQIHQHEYTFSIQELQRQRDFKNSMIKWEEEFKSKESDRQVEFVKSEKMREVEFRKSEQKRRSDFIEEEGTRQKEFRDEQQTRAKEFNEQQLKLAKNSLDAERERQFEFVEWRFEVTNKFETWMQDWSDRFEDESRNHEVVFGSLLKKAAAF
ncbi:hypothetical protein C8Q75DRAFT_113993 [Abortiporus biennis]|nr:hypothetical protein C8Q75DRAFT_113993 [Abortiporus biennis]